MTTANSTKSTFQRAQLGTLSVVAWTGDPEAGHDMPYLLVYSLGDGAGADGASESAIRALIEEVGLKGGADMTDATAVSVNSPIRLLIQGGHAVLNMPYLSAQCPAPKEWLAAADQRGHVHLIVAAQPWAAATPGEPITEETLQAFLGDEETLLSAGHILLPVSQLRS
ncbi:DUF5949 family protein [Streptomyces albipurpureus]|uniref:DUF5949 family protein n=1 Tax=Streptomyces albipurpureus TaxID=2897419 RepID=A0ABT0UP90_9ACTN|nr:DUF5949 family protein [Streptomyces sp. CWNU-1]MCM2389198.1 DUF5949 family protein [Streptomyces sp. CWNU-1]